MCTAAGYRNCRVRISRYTQSYSVFICIHRPSLIGIISSIFDCLLGLLYSSVVGIFLEIMGKLVGIKFTVGCVDIAALEESQVYTVIPSAIPALGVFCIFTTILNVIFIYLW